jgi:hypothetical protein
VLDGDPGPIPDMVERDGVVYFSQPMAVRSAADGFELERRRERVSPGGDRIADRNVIRLDVVSGGEIEAEGRAVGLRPAGRRLIDATADHVGSLVVMFDA